MRRIHRFTVICVLGLTFGVGCSGAGARKERIATGSQGLSTLCVSTGNSVPDLKTDCLQSQTGNFSISPSLETSPLGAIGNFAGALASVWGAYQTAQAIAQAAGILKEPVVAELQNLQNAISQIAGQVTYFESQTAAQDRATLLRTGIDTTRDQLANGPAPDWSVLDNTWSTAVNDGATDAAFWRAYDVNALVRQNVVPYGGSITNGFNWGDLVQYSTTSCTTSAPGCTQDLQNDVGFSNNYVYDWRLGLPALLQLVALRLTLFAMEDPNFVSDHKFQNQLMGFHDNLKKHLLRLEAGLRCGSREQLRSSFFEGQCGAGLSGYCTYDLTCVDFYSGINETLEVVCNDSNPCPVDFQTALNNAYQDVRLATPWFATQAMVDVLYRYANGVADLANSDPKIHATRAPELCLDLGGEGGVVAQLTGCSSAQSWKYDRTKQTLVANSSGLCLDAVSGNLFSPVIAKPCSVVSDSSTNLTVPVASQRWTYDPEHLVLNNALGNALEIPNGTFTSGHQLYGNISADLNGLGQDQQVYAETTFPPQQWNSLSPYLWAPNRPIGAVFPQACRSCSTSPIIAINAGQDGALYARSFQAGIYSGATPITGTSFAPVGAFIAAGPQTSSQTDAFVVGNDGAVYMTSLVVGGAWQAPTPLTPVNFAPPGASLDTATQSAQLGVAVVDNGGALQIISWNPALGWAGPVAVTGANFASPGAAVKVGQRISGELDVFSIGTDGALKYMAYDAGVWSGPWTLTAPNYAPPGSPLATAPDVYGYLNVFTVGSDGALYTEWECPSVWCGPSPITATGFAPTGALLSAVNFNNTSMGAFLVDNTGSINVLANAGPSWQGPWPISGSNVALAGASIAVTLDGSNQLDLFAVSVSGAALESIYANSTWSNPVLVE